MPAQFFGQPLPCGARRRLDHVRRHRESPDALNDRLLNHRRGHGTSFAPVTVPLHGAEAT
jgi:hypothetical protein